MEQIRLTLSEAGLCPRLQNGGKVGVFLFQKKRPSIAKPFWRISLSESDSGKLITSPNREEAIRWKKAVWKSQERVACRSIPVEGGMAIRVYEKVEELYSGPVYNLHVEEDESYTANGITVHNCYFARDMARRIMHHEDRPTGGTAECRILGENAVPALDRIAAGDTGFDVMEA
jgi:hypothetical protein